MKKMKVFFMAWIVTVSSAVLYTFFQSHNHKEVSDHHHEKSEWTTFKKFGPGSISYPSNKKELKAIKEQKHNHGHHHVERKPAAIDKSNKRVLYGIDESQRSSLSFSNKISEDWEKLLGDQLIRFQKPETKVLVKKLESSIRLHNGKAQYIEKVLVTYLFEDGRVNNFNALIDSETGTVVDTWNKTIHENFDRRSRKTLTPSGSL